VHSSLPRENLLDAHRYQRGLCLRLHRPHHTFISHLGVSYVSHKLRPPPAAAPHDAGPWFAPRPGRSPQNFGGIRRSPPGTWSRDLPCPQAPLPGSVQAESIFGKGPSSVARGKPQTIRQPTCGAEICDWPEASKVGSA